MKPKKKMIKMIVLLIVLIICTIQVYAINAGTDTAISADSSVSAVSEPCDESKPKRLISSTSRSYIEDGVEIYEVCESYIYEE